MRTGDKGGGADSRRSLGNFSGVGRGEEEYEVCRKTGRVLQVSDCDVIVLAFVIAFVLMFVWLCDFSSDL